jgi:DNA-binding response OmpR family regulator
MSNKHKEATMMKIHIAEDEIEISELLASFFQRKGFQVSTSTSAEEAMKTIDLETPDFAILDLFLEGQKNGLDILKFIKKKYPAVKTLLLQVL